MATANEKYVDYVNFSESSWKRPEGPPRVWRVVDGRRKLANGEIPRFSIQELPKGLEEDLFDFMRKNFLPEEPTNIDQGLADDPLAVRETRTMWRDVVAQGVSVVALMVNSDPTVNPVIVGVNILTVTTAEDSSNNKSKSKMQFKSKPMRKLMGVMSRLTKESDVMKRYGVDKYLGALGLSVDPSMRGQGLGEELLRARDDIGRAYQIPVSETVFTATGSQILATRVGFEVLVEKKYSELLDDEGKIAFPNVTVEFIKVMGKRLY